MLCRNTTHSHNLFFSIRILKDAVGWSWNTMATLLEELELLLELSEREGPFPLPPLMSLL